MDPRPLEIFFPLTVLGWTLDVRIERRRLKWIPALQGSTDRLKYQCHIYESCDTSPPSLINWMCMGFDIGALVV